MTFQFQVSKLRFCHHFEPFYVELFDFLEPDFHGLIFSKIYTKSIMAKNTGETKFLKGFKVSFFCSNAVAKV